MGFIRSLRKVHWRMLDPYILVPFATMCIIGVVMVYSASADIGIQNGGTPKAYLIKQTGFVIAGLLSMIFAFRVNIKKLTSPPLLMSLYVIFLGLLLYLKFHGVSINGSAGWFHLFGLGIQPAEFIKFYFILAYAKFASGTKNQDLMQYHWIKANRAFFAFSLVLLLLILKQPDLGGSAISFFIILVMAWTMMRNKFRAITYSIGLLLLGVLFLINASTISKIHFFANNYQFQRIVGFASPFQHAQNSGQQLVNSYYAFSNGGLFGVGLGNSIQKTGYLPEPNTDFIMAIISEELGAITVTIIIMLLMIIIIRIIWVGMRSRVVMETLCCYGTAAFLLVEAFFNIGGVVGLLPITGVTFPFISYGGSSMITLCLSLGVVLHISYRQRLTDKEAEANDNSKAIKGNRIR